MASLPPDTGVRALAALDSTHGLAPEVERALRQLGEAPPAALEQLRAMLLGTGEAHPSAADVVPVLAAFAAGEVDAGVRHGVIVLLAHVALGVAEATSRGTVVSPAKGVAAERLRAAFSSAYPTLRVAAEHDLPRLSGLVGTMKLLAEEQSFHHYQSMLAFIEIDG